ncbi:chemotaxis protein CheW [Pseudobacteriovorax antillogorgiicola]|uniref:Purine-binding chemotaxis protein CheW n=1 Tax=Pseudobacteriovorax antillogorgiicola TaxID=1513793 RepID=A0A1Y6CE05_9BACT|nr:chemotaxis protein CheW [Pseudobacteriovorax antillogorgiicola]TCS51700.1 purine-binding chemotaxis protein CheW [Pseudobacteriovorax antillogorgiicola]SMF49202.1 purine-binding chemotaxis protein CheW [Pseudobacteriovorax antillogorgiicola]
MADSNRFGFFDESPTTEAPKPTSPPPAQTAAPAQTSESSSTGPAPLDDYDGVKPYLVFSLGGTSYATPLLAAREVIEVPAFRAIPNTKDYFLGIANLRGEVVGLIDLRAMLGLATERSQRNSVIIYESESGPLGAMIDEVRGVVNLEQAMITTDVSIKTSVPQKYLQGIGQLPGDELVVVLDLKHILDEDDLLTIRGGELQTA